MYFLLVLSWCRCGKSLIDFKWNSSDTNAQVLSWKDSSSVLQQNRLIRQLLAQRKFKEILGSPEIPEEIWAVTHACWKDASDEKGPTMGQIYAQMSTILNAIESSTSIKVVSNPVSKPIKDISPEIKKLSEYPIAGGGYCDVYLGERLGREKVALKLVRLFGPSEQDKSAARKVRASTYINNFVKWLRKVTRTSYNNLAFDGRSTDLGRSAPS